MSKLIYTRLRDMAPELAAAVRAEIVKVWMGAPPSGHLSHSQVAAAVNAKFSTGDYQVAISSEVVRWVIRAARSTAAATGDKKFEPRTLTPEEQEAAALESQRSYALAEENKLLRRKLKRATEEQTALTALQKGAETVSREAALILPSFEPIDIIAREPGEHIEEAVVLCSCLHYGEVVSEDETSGFGKYNIPIAQAAIQVMTDSVLNLILDHHRGLHIRKLWYIELGDAVSGDIHEELRVTNERPIVSQVIGSGLLRALSLRDLAAHIDEVEHVGIVGNHGRTTRRPAFKQKSEDSYDRLSYEVTGMLVSQLPNVKTTVVRSPKHLMEINGHRFLFEHGDSIRMWMGFPYYGAVREQAKLLTAFVNAKAMMAENKQFADYLSKGFRYFCFGNFHTSMITDGPHGSELIATGSPKGVDEYSWSRLSTGSQPSQQFFGVHGRRGVSFRYRLDLTERDPAKHKRYLFDLSDVSLREAAGELGLLGGREEV